VENKTTDNAGASGAEPLVKRGYLFLEDSDWNKADEYFDKALDANPEHAPAYIGKLCAELRVRREDSLGDYQEVRQGRKIDKPLGEYGHFQKALRFADDGYRNKLNGYEQKIKDSFPKKIPQIFTDKFIKGEIARLEKEIADCDKKITENKNACINLKAAVDYANNFQKKIVEDYKNMYETYQEAREHLKDNELYNDEQKRKENFYEKMGEANNLIDEYTKKKDQYEAKKNAIKALEGISSCLDRMDGHYNRFVEAIKKKSTEDEYFNFAEQFRLLEGYKDSAQLTDKCAKLAIKTKYERLVQEKNNASTVDKYEQLAEEFSEMGDYENSSQLADECDKLAIKTKYDGLVQEKNKASSEDEYTQLAEEFREMGGYENSSILADECDKQVRVLKERSKEQERQEAERKRKEAAEQENARYVRQREEAEEKARKRRKANVFSLISIVSFIVGMVFYYIAFKEWMDNMINGDNPLIDLLLPLLSLGLPILIWNIKREILVLKGLSFFIFIIAIIIHIFVFALGGYSYFFYWGSIAMVLSFIMAIISFQIIKIMCPYYNQEYKQCVFFGTTQDQSRRDSYCLTSDNWKYCPNYTSRSFEEKRDKKLRSNP
jgi:hypothetical protein